MLHLVLMFACAVMSASAQPLVTDNVIAYWPMDGDATDASGNGHDGNIQGTFPVNDRFGSPQSALGFDGVDDFVELPASPELKPTLPVTFAAWVKCDGPDCHLFSNDYQDNYYRGIFIHIFNHKLSASIGSGDVPGTGPPYRRTKASSIVLPEGQWVHVAAVVRSGLDMDLYVDGSPDLNAVYTGDGGELVYSQNPGTIGKWDSSVVEQPWFSVGAIDEVYFLDRALTHGEVFALFSNIVPVERTSFGALKAHFDGSQSN